MKERIIQEEKAVLRHSPVELAEHWILAVSGLLLIFSGFGELPMYKRFMVTQIPGFSWAGDYFINLKIHYLAAIVFVSVILFHVFYHGLLKHQGLIPKKGDVNASVKTILSFFGFGEEPKASKYLAEQRLAYAYFGGVGLILVVTGILKVIKNLPSVHMSPGFITWITLIHTFATIFFLLGVLAHLAALVLKVNHPMVRPIFTGKMDLEYVRRRHTLWYDELQKAAEPKIESIKDELQPPEKVEGEVKPAIKGEEEPEVKTPAKDAGETDKETCGKTIPPEPAAAEEKEREKEKGPKEPKLNQPSPNSKKE